jgi:hypothetical protein
MRILTYATDYNHDNIKLLKTKLQIECIPNYISWTNDFYAKAYAINKYIQNIDNDEYVIICDGYDVLPLNGCSSYLLHDALHSYFDMNKITFNAETNCYPDSILSDYYPNKTTKWKYLNAGIYGGMIKLIKIMLNQTLPNIKGSMDQREYTKLFLSNPDLITLDYECKIFQTLYNGKIGGDINLQDFIIENNKIKNKYFNTYPLLFHGNGKINMSTLTPFL